MKPYLLILLFLPLWLHGQSRMGEWKAHFAFHRISKLCETKEAIIGASENGILFYNKADGRLSTMTKAEGLSDVGIAAINHAEIPGYTIIGYENGNIDLLQGKKVTNIPDLLRKSSLNYKQINKIVCEGTFAYLCSSFGILKLDLVRLEIAETWYFGTSISPVPTYDLTSYHDSLWIATSEGILKIDQGNKNLQDFRQWEPITSIPNPASSFSSFGQAEGKLFIHNVTNDQLIQYDGKKWQRYDQPIKNIRNIKSSFGGLIVIAASEVRVLGSGTNLQINSYPPDPAINPIEPGDALISQSGEIWIGDQKLGLTRRLISNTFQHLIPDGPYSDQVKILVSNGDDLYLSSTIPFGLSEEASIAIYKSGSWKNINSLVDTKLKGVAPVSDFAFNKDLPDEFWASTEGSGILYFQKNSFVTRFDENNSSLGAIGGTCKVDGILLDNNKNLWYTNPTGKINLGVKKADGSWKTLSYPEISGSGQLPDKLLLSKSGTKWVNFSTNGLFAFKDNNTPDNPADDQHKKVQVVSKFSNSTGTSLTSFEEVNAVSEDLDHQLWIGTEKGIVVYPNPDAIFSSGDFYGIQPSLDNKDGYFSPLLEKEKVTAIAVDGGNRKWIGTDRSGAFLFSDRGDYLLKHFDSGNSPLPSDHIQSIAISDQTGEIFFATDKGVVSYKGTAAKSNESFENAYVWPNPLRETSAGGVTIDGLNDQTKIKITDLSGNLIYSTESEGGRAIWDAKNRSGNRVSTGVYLIFCTSSDSGVSKIIKLLVIH